MIAPRPLSAESFVPSLKVRLLVMQPTPFCNINCDYCYLAHRQLARFMTPEVVEATLRNLRGCDLVGDELTIIWHAGEPLVAPRSFYSAAFHWASALLSERTRVTHSIQTNGLLLDDAWCSLFREHDVHIGVSLDGPAFLHDRHRKTRQGKGTHADVMRGIECLRRNQLPFHVISVVTADALPHADAFVDFFVTEGIRQIALNIDEQEGVNLRSSLAARDDAYVDFLRRLLESDAVADGRLRIRELERLSTVIAKGLSPVQLGPLGLLDNDQVLPFAITTVDHEGNFSCFSPELIDQVHAGYGAFTFGNVRDTRVLDVLSHPRFLKVYDDILSGIARCRARCRYFKLCGGGAPVNKLNENGSFDCDETDYCRKTLQQPLEIVLAMLERETGIGRGV